MGKQAPTAEFVQALQFDRSGYTDAELLDLYRAILLPRMIEDKMLILLRQGRVSKWFSGMGQEAIAVGAAKALKNTDYILPLHRNLGVFTNRDMNLTQLFAQWQGKREGFTKGRDRSFHFGSAEHRIIGMISHLGAMLPVADGISLASNLDGDDVISFVFSGDGGASEGDFHEAINVAAVWELPVIFCIENNGYGLSTPSREQFRQKQFIDKAIGYGIEGIQIDGNNILEVHRAIKKIAAQMRVDRKPVLLECMTFRMRGHEEASGTKYVPQELFDMWGKKDPVMNFEKFLLETGVLSEQQIESIRKDFKQLINQHWDETFALPEVEADADYELADVYAPFDGKELKHAPTDVGTRELRFVDACREALYQAMEHDDKLVLMGQDIAEYGGVFKVTEGFVDAFGKGRVRNTPLCESAIIGAGLGMSIRGRSSVIEMQFADFVSCGFNQIVNNLAKNHYRWGQNASVVVRMPTGAGSAAGPFHSQSNEAWFTKVAGLKVVFPSNPYDAKGLLTTSILDPNPVIFFEHKALYRSVSNAVPEAYYNLPLGQAAVVKEGTDLTIVSYGWSVHWAMQIAQESSASIEVIDLRTLIPWDKETVRQSLAKTGKCLIVHEDTLTMGFGAEVAATIAEEMFELLDGPVKRVGSLDTPVPFNKVLEDDFLANRRLKAAVEDLLKY